MKYLTNYHLGPTELGYVSVELTKDTLQLNYTASSSNYERLLATEAYPIDTSVDEIYYLFNLAEQHGWLTTLPR